MQTVMQWIRSNPRIPHTPRELSLKEENNKVSVTGVSLDLFHKLLAASGTSFETSDVAYLKDITPNAA